MTTPIPSPPSSPELIARLRELIAKWRSHAGEHRTVRNNGDRAVGYDMCADALEAALAAAPVEPPSEREASLLRRCQELEWQLAKLSTLADPTAPVEPEPTKDGDDPPYLGGGAHPPSRAPGELQGWQPIETHGPRGVRITALEQELTAQSEESLKWHERAQSAAKSLQLEHARAEAAEAKVTALEQERDELQAKLDWQH
jgi:hypothetical protein